MSGSGPESVPEESRRKRRWLLLALALGAFLALVGLLCLKHLTEEEPAEPQGPPVRSATAIGIRSGDDVPDYAWWAGKPLPKQHPFLIQGGDRDSTVVAYVTPQQAKRARKGLWITDALVTVHTVREGSLHYKRFINEGLPAAAVKKIRGLGTVYAGDELLWAIVVPDEGDELIAVGAISPRLLDWTLARLQRGRKTSDASGAPTN